MWGGRRLWSKTPQSLSFLLHSLLIYPFLSLQINGDGRSVSRQIKDEKSIFLTGRDGLAQLFELGLSGMLQSGWVDGSKINIFWKASRWIMNWDRLFFLWLLLRSTEVVSGTTTWLQCALWEIKHWPSFISISLYIYKCSKMMKHCTKLALNNNMGTKDFTL